jgi:2-polyprenyl-6-methoxyphenol hydroxylase-like FAD-dependent oxidoreductase
VTDAIATAQVPPAEATDVLIVGAGPTGLVAAGLLERLGLSVRILDPYESRLAVPKAHVVGPVSLDVLAHAGFDLEQVRSGARRAGEDKWVSIRTTLFGAELGRLPYEYQSPDWTGRVRLNIAQPKFEAILERELRTRKGIDYQIGRWTGLRETGDQVVSTAIVGGQEVELSSRYLLAADGANSSVRAQLGVALEQYAPPSPSRSIHIHADLRPWLEDEGIVLALTTDPSAPGGFILYDPACEATFVMHGVDTGTLTTEAATEQVRLGLGRDDVPFEVKGISHWEMASEVAPSFRYGRVFLLGDAAHRLPPTGGLGMNSGIQDSANLAWKIAAVLDGWAGDALLDTYDAERRPVSVEYTRQSSENNDAHQTMRREVGRSLASSNAPSAAAAFDRLAERQWVGFNCPGLQLDYGYGPGQKVESPGEYRPSAEVGRRVPHTEVTVDGSSTPVIDLIDRRGFTMFVRGSGPAWEERTTSARVPIAVVDIGATVNDAMWLHQTGLSVAGAALVVRPDGHVIGRCAHLDDWPRVQRVLADHARRGLGYEPVAAVHEPAPFREFVPPLGHPRYKGLDADVVTYSDGLVEHLNEIGMLSRALEEFATPFVGITESGVTQADLFPLAGELAPTAEIVAAATRLLGVLDDEGLSRLLQPLHSENWRKWFNPEIYLFRHGIRLDEVSPQVRDATMGILRASLSPEGFEKASDCMYMNAFLGQVVGAPQIMNEFSYNFSIFGEPSLSEPWGWQITGHHLILNCFLLGDQMVMSPLFFGAEPNEVDEGPRTGLEVLTVEESVGLALVNALPADLRAQAVLFEDPYGPDVPVGRVAVADHLHLCGLARDNRVVPYEGVAVALFDDPLRDLVVDLIGAYTRHLPEGPRRARRQACIDHLADSWFCWIGLSGPDDPFYYRLQSPVAIFEFDHHPGVFLTNERARKFHIHTIVRTPNGNDYGSVLLRQYEQSQDGSRR